MSGSFRIERPRMIGDGALSFREFVMREPLPLATIQEAVLEFLSVAAKVFRADVDMRALDRALEVPPKALDRVH